MKQREQRQQAVERKFGSIDERATVTARLGPLDDQRVGARALGLVRFRWTGDRDPDLGAAALQCLDHRPVRAAEGERDNGYAIAEEQLDLRVPVIVAVGRLAERKVAFLGP